MKNAVICLFLAIQFLSCAQQDAKPIKQYPPFVELDDSKHNQLEAEIIHVVDSFMHAQNIPSINLAIIRDNRLLVQKGFGVQDRDSKKEVDATSIYQIGSLSKMFTGIIANQLMDEGLLSKDKSILDYLPSSVRPKARKRLQAVTVRHVLNHHAGFMRSSKVSKRIDGDPMLVGLNEDDLIQDINLMKLKHKPGEKFMYSNMGFAILGYICERASGMSYEALLQKYVANPFQLNNMTTTLSEQQLPNLVRPYRKDDRNVKSEAWQMGKLTPGGGIYTTIEDLLMIMTNQMNAYNDEQSSFHPLVLTQYTGTVKDETAYGFGLFKLQFRQFTAYGHDGDLDGFGSSYLFMPEIHTGVMLLTSSGGRWIDGLNRAIWNKLLNAQ